MILLDTQTLVWFYEGESTLGEKARILIDAASDMRSCSAISFWELAMLADKSRVSLSLPVDRWTARVAKIGRIAILPVTGELGIDAGELPGGIHGDPADRIIVATARALDCALVTTDRKILAHAPQGHVKAVDARR